MGDDRGTKYRLMHFIYSLETVSEMTLMKTLRVNEDICLVLIDSVHTNVSTVVKPSL